MYKTVWKHLFKATKKYHFLVIISTILFGTALVGVQFKPLVIQKLIDGAIAGNPLGKYVIQMGFLLLGVTIIFRLFDYIIIYTQRKAFRDLQNYAMDKLLEHSYSFFTNNFSGSLVAKTKRFANGFIMLQDVFTFAVFNAIFMILIVTTILFFKNTTIALVFLGWSVIYSITSIMLTKKQKKYDEKNAKEDSNTTALLSDILTNMLTIKMFATRKKERRSFYNQTDKQEVAMKNSWNYMWKVFAIQAFLLAILEFLTIYFAVKGYEAGTITIGTVILIQMYSITLFGSVWNLGRGFQKMSRALSEMKEMVDIIEQEPEIKDKQKPLKTKIKKGEIKFEGVTFEYDKEAILKDFSIHIKPGEKIGLVGISGSGKSTITKLILRFFDPRKGTIKIDGQNIKEIKQEELRQQITYVPQEPLLFHRTIEENISYAKKTSKKEIVEAARKANAHEFITKLPKGYNTLVGERGIKLSGGERQRVAIARAILKEAPIIVMDEATSSLDTLSEKYIQESTEKLMQNKTAIIIAHRLSTVQRLDRIIVLKKGCVVEEGTHSQLLKKKGEYYKLYRHQELN